VIAYFDTSALVPLIIAEPASSRCRSVWDAADAVLCADLGYVEAAAALARARRAARMTDDEHQESLRRLDDLWGQLLAVPVDGFLVREAAGLAAEHALRAYDAVHCAAAGRLADSATVAVSGDQALLRAWSAEGLATIDPST
jgi:predicted nucleic acid-binding protein